MSTVKSKVRSFIDPVFDVIVYRQEGAADPPPGVSPLVHKLPDSSVHTYRRLLTPGHGPSTCSNPHISWNTPHDPKWYTAKQAALALKSNRMRKKPYTGALILARRWALEDKLRGDTGVPEFSDRELSYMELGMKRKNGADVVRKAQMLAENLPKVLVVRMAQQLEPHELQLAGLDMVPETEPFWCFVVLPGARDMSYES
ncbi:hypothetical protein BROUX41_003757 [Berkeleyomyces rouxiae]|uniref:uncharacterized protein n=1 Tax=Berkeleyomyces rouxiae TaxID=2035830 RepID=UPI003B824094